MVLIAGLNLCAYPHPCVIKQRVELIRPMSDIGERGTGILRCVLELWTVSTISVKSLWQLKTSIYCNETITWLYLLLMIYDFSIFGGIVMHAVHPKPTLNQGDKFE